MFWISLACGAITALLTTAAALVTRHRIISSTRDADPSV
jgi:hypothetical protein